MTSSGAAPPAVVPEDAGPAAIGGSPEAPSGRPLLVLVSIDTEEDAWTPARADLTVENIRRLPRFHSILRVWGVRPTYFVSHAVTAQPWAADLIAGTVGDDGELAAHLHPWNTPPLEEPLVGANTMLHNLPSPLQRRKLATLTCAHERAFGRRPRAFRAGRFGLGAAMLPALVEQGYRVDSSVTPYWSWKGYDDGPDFRGAPDQPYRLSAASTDVRRPDRSGEIAELPVSVGFTRRPFGLWAAVHRAVDSRPLRPWRLGGLAARAGLFQRIIMTPENESAHDMLALARAIVRRGGRYLHMFLHSSSLVPGLTTCTPRPEDVTSMENEISIFLDELTRREDVRFVTATEAAEILLPMTAATP